MSNDPAIKPLVGIVMGSSSDWPTMQNAARSCGTSACLLKRKSSVRIARQLLYDYATTASERGLKCIIAGAGGAAHLPGMAASMTISTRSRRSGAKPCAQRHGQPLFHRTNARRHPVATFAIGNAGALTPTLAVSMLANENPDLAAKLKTFRKRQSQKVLESQKELEAESKA